VLTGGAGGGGRGPCIDDNGEVVGRTGLVVIGDGGPVTPSLNYEELECGPGASRRGVGSEADGFLYDSNGVC